MILYVQKIKMSENVPNIEISIESAYPTQQCKPPGSPCAGDIKEEEDALHRCSIGACAGIFSDSILSKSSSINFISFPLFLSYVPVGKQVSNTHC